MTSTDTDRAPNVLLTIATCVLNARDDFLQTAASLPEVLPDWVEWIVMDGASKDGTLDAIRAEPRVTRSRSERDRGVYDAYNKALAAASGRFIWYLNAGDTAVAAAFPELGRAVAESSRAARVPVLCHGVEMQKAGKTWDPQPDSLLDCMSVPTPGALIPIEALRELGGFDTGYRIAADYDVLLRLYKGGLVPFETRDAVLSRYKGDGLSTVQADLAFFEECVALLRSDRSRGVHCLLRAARRLVQSDDRAKVPFRRWRIALACARRFLY